MKRIIFKKKVVIFYFLIFIFSFFLFFQNIREIFALNQSNYNRAVGERLTLDQWNQLDEDFMAQDPALYDLNMNNNRVTNLGAPVNGNDAVNMQYLSGQISSLITNSQGTIQDEDGNSMEIVCGTANNWGSYGQHLNINVTHTAGFTSTPYYFTFLVESTSDPNPAVDVADVYGSSSIYNPTPNSFSLYILIPVGITPAEALAQGWSLVWCGVGN